MKSLHTLDSLMKDGRHHELAGSYDCLVAAAISHWDPAA